MSFPFSLSLSGMSFFRFLWHRIFRIVLYFCFAFKSLARDCVSIRISYMFKNMPKNVIALGFVSLFNDIASEMIYPLVPFFLTSVLVVPVSIVGLIEGIAEATASITKFLFGYISDRMQKRKIFVIAG